MKASTPAVIAILTGFAVLAVLPWMGPFYSLEDANEGKRLLRSLLANTSEKKKLKEMDKLGMRPVPGIIRVTVKKAQNVLFVIAKPDVFMSPSAETYVVFGEAQKQDRRSRRILETSTKSDKKLSAFLKKIRATNVPGVEEVNLFKEDGKVIRFVNPDVKASVAANAYIISETLPL